MSRSVYADRAEVERIGRALRRFRFEHGPLGRSLPREELGAMVDLSEALIYALERRQPVTLTRSTLARLRKFLARWEGR